MKRWLLTFIFGGMLLSYSQAQCDISFENDAAPPLYLFSFPDVDPGIAGTDIVNFNTSAAYSGSFDIYDEANNDCSTTGGANDITIDVEVLAAFDAYGGTVLNSIPTSNKHRVVQDATGLKGTNPMGQNAGDRTSSGDVRGYEIKVNFAPHVIILAEDMTVNTTSVNTAGEAYESTVIVFFNESGIPLGSASYNGMYVDADGPGGIHPSILPDCVTAPTLNTPANVYTTTGTGVYVMSDVGTTVPNTGNYCTPTAGVNGTDNNKDVNAATDAGLPLGTRVGGFSFTVLLEDIAVSPVDGVDSGSRTNFTSTLNGITIAAAALPVELSSFSVRRDGDHAALSWTTASEENSSHFLVEHSTDGTDFVEIGSVEAMGNSAKNTDYAFTHREPMTGQNYYRLKQVDMDGAFSYSKTELLRFHNTNGIAAQPSLANHSIHAVLDQAADHDLDYAILDMTGRRLTGGLIPAGGISQEIPVEELPNGQYFLIVQGKDDPMITRFVKY